LDDLNWSKVAIYDDLYGYIKLTDIELEIVDHPLFQRLNHIRQLGNAFRVFPGAQHTRFSHSLGVMHLMDRILTSGNIGEFDSEERQKLRLAALLHDIGHYPFSHAIESIYTDDGKNSEGKHENFGAYILSKYSIKEILTDKNYNPEEISNIFLARSGEVIHNQLISSQFDVDRCDYLLRDSMNTGVNYGRFDLDRMIHTVRKSNDDVLGIHEKGIRAADGYTIGRYLMWTTVYNHKTIAGYDELLKNAFLNIVDKKYFTINKLKVLSENDLIKFTDNYVLNLIYNNINFTSEYKSKICKMYCSRNFKNRLQIVDEEKHFSLESKRSERFFQLDQYGNKKVMKRLQKRDDDIKKWVFHSSSITKLPTLHPMMYGELLKVKEEGGILGEEMMKVLYIIDDNNEKNIYGYDPHSLAGHLINLSYDVVRIYSRIDLIDKVKKALKEDISEYSS